jgi:hypothetical protein
MRRLFKGESVPLELKILVSVVLMFDEYHAVCYSNTITLEDTNGNRKLSERNEDKIDNVSAMMDGYVATKPTRRHSNDSAV